MLRDHWQLLLVLLFLSGCSLFEPDDQTEPPVTLTIVIPTPAETPTRPPTPIATEPVVESSPTTLNVWMVADVSPLTDDPGASILAEQLASFDASHPDLSLNVEIKVPTGQGGTLSYLRTGRGTAPSILPDLVILPVDRLPTAASEELIYPLDSLLSQEMQDDLFPAASALARVDDQVFGYPFALTNLQHLAHSSAVFTDTVPLTWDRLLEVEEATLVFPGAGTPGAVLALQFYLASGGTLTTEANQPVLQVEPLTNALNQLSRGRTSGLILIQSSNLTTFDESWLAFVNGAATTALTESSQFLDERLIAPDRGFAAVPGIERPLAPLAKGWAWAVSTPDPARQALAAELLGWMAAGPNLGDWSVASSTLPARQSAFEQWPAEDPYTDFLQGELERAQPYPGAATSTVLNALSSAVFDVLSLAKSPQVAAEEAAASLVQ